LPSDSAEHRISRIRIIRPTVNIIAVARPVLVRAQALQNLRGHHPGTCLIGRELCGVMGISRASVREVVRQLETELLLHVEPRRGPMVTALGIDEAREIYEIRAVLESRIAARFASVATEAEMDHLAAPCAEVEAQDRDPAQRAGMVKAMSAPVQHRVRVGPVDHQRPAGLHESADQCAASACHRPARTPGAKHPWLSVMLAAISARDPEAAASRGYVRNASVAAPAYMKHGCRQGEGPAAHVAQGARIC